MTEQPQSGIRDELAAVRHELGVVSRQLSELTTRFSYMADHESRIRALENAMARSAWLPVIVTSVLMAGLGALVVRIIDFGM